MQENLGGEIGAAVGQVIGNHYFGTTGGEIGKETGEIVGDEAETIALNVL